MDPVSGTIKFLKTKDEGLTQLQFVEKNARGQRKNAEPSGLGENTRTT